MEKSEVERIENDDHIRELSRYADTFYIFGFPSSEYKSLLLEGKIEEANKISSKFCNDMYQKINSNK